MRFKRSCTDVLVVTLIVMLPLVASSSMSNSTSLRGGGSVTVTVRKEGEVTGMLLFLGEGQEVTINGADPETKCIKMSNQREIEVRIIQDGVPQGERQTPQARQEAAGAKYEVIAELEVKNCLEVQNLGNNISGIYNISPYELCPEHRVDVYCDMDTSGGGWTVIQNRDLYGAQGDFFRPWTDYVNGFGDLSQDFWLGIRRIHALTSQSPYEMRLDMIDFDGNARYATYDSFSISNEDYRYEISFGEYLGGSDPNPDPENCAVLWESAWWFRSCYTVHVENQDLEGPNSKKWLEVIWGYWRGYSYPPKKSEIKIRPKT
uniref:FREP2 n=1 Tax=Penaeus japonicus TaxID=27405 RepID=A0A075DNZ6_PENJP|nr:FREP2 [Penaeus japonicus]